MNYFENDVFRYQGGELYCELVPIREIALHCDTPCFVYSKQGMIARYNRLKSAFAPLDVTVFYALKANFNLSVLKVFLEAGSSLDVNSAGELYRALKAGATGDKLLLTGVGKRIEEIEAGLNAGVTMVKAESREEVELLQSIAAEKNITIEIALRVNPNVNPETHPYISTGLAENKFGIPIEEAKDIYLAHSRYSHLKFTGIDMHIGSQITTPRPHAEAAEILAGIYSELQKKGVPLSHFDIGGGFGVNYQPGSEVQIEDFAKELLPVLNKITGKIYLEPGRSLIANAGALLSRVQYRKNNGVKEFVVVDAAMTDLLRPSIYGAYHHIQPVVQTDNADIVADVVGPVCESGDFLAKSRPLTDLHRNDVLAVMSAGAYGMVMSSNYNARSRAAEVLVSGNKFKVIRSRETYSHQIYDEDKLM